MRNVSKRIFLRFVLRKNVMLPSLVYKSQIWFCTSNSPVSSCQYFECKHMWPHPVVHTVLGARHFTHSGRQPINHIDSSDVPMASLNCQGKRHTCSTCVCGELVFTVLPVTSYSFQLILLNWGRDNFDLMCAYYQIFSHYQRICILICVINMASKSKK